MGPGDFAWTGQKARTILGFSGFLSGSRKNTAGKRNVWPFCGLENVLVLSVKQDLRVVLFLSCSITVTE